MSYWLAPPMWLGETCFILAGGPSLVEVYAPALAEYGRTIVINDSYRMLPGADLLYFCDLKWWERNYLNVARMFKGQVVTLENQIAGIHRLRNTGELGLDSDPSCLRTGHNSGYQAINLAYHLGVARIVLLGYDMQVGTDGRTHWHIGHPHQTSEAFDRLLKSKFLPAFETLVEPLADAKIEVINATSNSLLDCWPRRSLTDVLYNLREEQAQCLER